MPAREISARKQVKTALLLLLLTIPLFFLAWRSYELDFRAFYVASQSLAHNLDPYLDNHEHGEQFADPVGLTGISRWVYPPPALFFVAPLARLPYNTARLLFELVSMAALLWALFHLSVRFEIPDLWIALAYVSLPVIACVERGQIDLLILFSLVLTFACGRSAWAGVPLSIAISIKIFPAVILIWFIVQRRFREALATIACTVVIGILSIWRFGVSSYAECFRSLTRVRPIVAYADPVDLVHRFGIPNINSHWLSLSQGFIGSYNNPLVLLNNSGIILGGLFAIAAAALLTYKKVSPEVGFFTMVLVSQALNIRLWSMGFVMYLPIFLLLIKKLASLRLALLLMIPLYLPSQVRVVGINPRFVIGLALISYALASHSRREKSGGLAKGEDAPPQSITDPSVTTAMYGNTV